MAGKVLTRQEMADIIGRGEAVTHNGQHLTHISQIPSIAEMAAADPQQAQALLAQKLVEAADLQKQIAAIQAVTGSPNSTLTPGLGTGLGEGQQGDIQLGPTSGNPNDSLSGGLGAVETSETQDEEQEEEQDEEAES